MEKQIEAYLYEHIPISKAIGVKVDYASPHKVILSAPFANNINHKQTVFGGSLHAVATLACWSLLHLNLKDERNPQIQIVITKSEINYYAPVDSDFEVECLIPDNSAWQRFLKVLHLKGKARIQLSARIYHKERLSVDYKAIFAALSVQ
jgi:thioesterase domain-containing protein